MFSFLHCNFLLILMEGCFLINKVNWIAPNWKIVWKYLNLCENDFAATIRMLKTLPFDDKSGIITVNFSRNYV